MEYGADFQQVEEQLMNSIQDDLLEMLRNEKEEYKKSKITGNYVIEQHARMNMMKEVCERFGVL